MNWIDNADSYICPRCHNETSNPAKHGYKCLICGFIAEKDKGKVEKMEKIKIKYHADIEKIKKIEKGDWIDLRAAEDVSLMLGESKVISLGISMELPEGYEAHVAPRSSTFKNFGIILVNGIGIIDNSYCGNDDVWMFPALCLKSEGSVIKRGDRIAQFRIMKKQPEISFEEVEQLSGKNRGGIGSTGKD